MIVDLNAPHMCNVFSTEWPSLSIYSSSCSPTLPLSHCHCLWASICLNLPLHFYNTLAPVRYVQQKSADIDLFQTGIYISLKIRRRHFWSGCCLAGRRECCAQARFDSIFQSSLHASRHMPDCWQRVNGITRMKFHPIENLFGVFLRRNLNEVNTYEIQLLYISY